MILTRIQVAQRSLPPRLATGSGAPRGELFGFVFVKALPSGLWRT
jgi:hypothetical protein